MRAQERRQPRHHCVHPDALRDRCAHGAFRPIVEAIDLVADAVELFFNPPSPGKHAPAGFGHHVAAGLERNQGRLAPARERRQSPSHRRLTATQAPRGCGQGARAREREKEAQVVPILHAFVHSRHSRLSHAVPAAIAVETSNAQAAPGLRHRLRHLLRAALRGGHSRHSGRAHRSARARVRLVARHHLLCHLRQPAALRADGAVLRHHRRAHRHPAHHGLGDGPARCIALCRHVHARILAAGAHLGPLRRRRLGNGRAGHRRGGGHALVTKNRGLVMGMLTASTATGQLLFLPVLAKAVETDGWRAAVRIVGVVALAALALALIFVRESPAELGLPAYGDTEVRPIVPPAENPARVALRALTSASRSTDFWLLSGTFFICGASTNGLIGTHLIPACFDHGIPEVRAAGLLATMGIFDLAGTTASGWFTDRFDSRKLLFTYYALRGLALIFLPRALTAQSGLFVFAVFYGLDWIATVPPTMRLATESFGAAEGPIVFGWIVAAHQVGAGMAALGAGLIRTSLGDYQLAFMSAGALCFFAAALALAVGRVRIGFPAATSAQ